MLKPGALSAIIQTLKPLYTYLQYQNQKHGTIVENKFGYIAVYKPDGMCAEQP